MLKRIVKMTFRPEETEQFELIFRKKMEIIRSVAGCNSLELIKDKSGNVFFTISLWDSEIELNDYRNSDLFEKTWSAVKPLFASRPEAWSTHIVEYLP